MRIVPKGFSEENPYKTVNPVARTMAILIASVLLAACGGGGGSSNGGGGNDGSQENTVKLSTFQEADIVIGQADFVGSEINQNGTAEANTLNRPTDSALADDTLFIVDNSNNRVLGFNGLPGVNNMTATFVLGQPDFTSDAEGSDRNGMKRPESIAIGNGKMAVADLFNRRVLIYNSVPVGSSAQPDVVVGQVDFTSGSLGCAQDEIRGPGDVTITPEGKLVVLDPSNHRVLIWNSLPTSNGQGADLVLGQSDFTHCKENDDNQDGTVDAAPTARTFDSPRGLWTDGNRLVVMDRSNNRALIWSSFPTSNFQAADLVLGQGDFIHNARNDDDQDGSSDSDASGRTLELPQGVDSNGVQLAIADQINSRVLIWNSFPTSNFEPADVVLGQGDFNHHRGNDDNQDGISDAAATARTLLSPSSVRFINNGLLVVDSSNNRVLVYRPQ
ncbi:NHL repeat-containing protein [Alloalcanivorax profundimaris]|uniref:hypothetical protein n=1 Tax=Alloalcanivorax profundimaris TaxID=2735259 RepID=UPI0018918E2D|nr:hypothetical protein [Alloalcanivorax profundimaris]